MEDVSVIKKAAEMNAEHLLAHFDRIADAPDAIPRLRRFILDLAVRGKLVPQDPNDEPGVGTAEADCGGEGSVGEGGGDQEAQVLLVIDAGDSPFTNCRRVGEWKRLSEISRKIHYGGYGIRRTRWPTRFDYFGSLTLDNK